MNTVTAIGTTRRKVPEMNPIVWSVTGIHVHSCPWPLPRLPRPTPASRTQQAVQQGKTGGTSRVHGAGAEECDRKTKPQPLQGLCTTQPVDASLHGSTL